MGQQKAKYLCLRALLFCCSFLSNGQYYPKYSRWDTDMTSKHHLLYTEVLPPKVGIRVEVLNKVFFFFFWTLLIPFSYLLLGITDANTFFSPKTPFLAFPSTLGPAEVGSAEVKPCQVLWPPAYVADKSLHPQSWSDIKECT